MAQALLNQQQVTGLSGVEFEVVTELQQIFPDHAMGMLTDLVNSVIREIGPLDIQDLMPICVQKVINRQIEVASTNTERRNDAVELNPMQKQVLPHLHAIFANIPKAVIETSVRHHSNLLEPLDDGLLLQRCIDDLLDRRTAGEATSRVDGEGQSWDDADVMFTGRDSPKDVVVTGVQQLHDKVNLHASDDEVLIFDGGEAVHQSVKLKGTFKKNLSVTKQTTANIPSAGSACTVSRASGSACTVSRASGSACTVSRASRYSLTSQSTADSCTSIDSRACDNVAVSSCSAVRQSSSTVGGEISMNKRKSSYSDLPAASRKQPSCDTCTATVTRLDRKFPAGGTGDTYTVQSNQNKLAGVSKSQSADNFATLKCTATSGCKSSLSIEGNSKSSKCHTETIAALTNDNCSGASSTVSSLLETDEHVRASSLTNAMPGSTCDSNLISTLDDKKRSFPWRANDSDSSLFDDDDDDKSDIDKASESSASDLEGLPEITFHQRIRAENTYYAGHLPCHSKSHDQAVIGNKAPVTGGDKPAFVLSTTKFAMSQRKTGDVSDKVLDIGANRAGPSHFSASNSTCSLDSSSSIHTLSSRESMSDSEEDMDEGLDESVQIVQGTVQDLTYRSVLDRPLPAPPLAYVPSLPRPKLHEPEPRPQDPEPIAVIDLHDSEPRPQDPQPFAVINLTRASAPEPLPSLPRPKLHDPEPRPHDPAPVIIAQQKPKMDVKTEVLSLFPDVDPHYVDELCLYHQGQTAVNNICFVLLETKYPRKVTEPAAAESVTVTPKPASIDYFKDYQSVMLPRHLQSKYECQAVDLLCAEFSWVSVRSIKLIYRRFDRYAPAYQCMDCVWEQAKMIVASSGKDGKQVVRLTGLNFTAEIKTPRGSEKVGIYLLKGRRPSSHLKSGYVAELEEEVKFVQQKLMEKTMNADHEVAQQLNEQEYEDQGQCIECGCCYGEYPFDNMVQCYDGHLFCESCLRQYAQESVFGHGKAILLCLTDACESMFPKNQLEKALSSEILARYEDRVTEENLNLADIGGDLVRCPHCEFAAFMDPDDKVFRCQNDKCGKQTCRYCKEDWGEHFGKKCEEIEKKDETKLRVQYEERMTQAKVRICHKCKAQFMKETGCNKMICRCGAKMCYICRKPNIDYNHFCQHPREPGKVCDKCKECSLWTNADEDDDRAVAEIQKEAGETRKNQGYIDDKLIGVPSMPPSKKPKIDGHNHR